MITLHHQVLPNEGRAVTLDCPACGAMSAESVPSESIDYVKLAYLIPLLKLRATSIRCGKCNADISCAAPMEQVAGQDAAFIAPLLRYHPSSAAKIWSMIGLITSVIPILGLITVSIALFHSRGTRGWPASINTLGIILAITSTVLGLLMFFMP